MRGCLASTRFLALAESTNWPSAIEATRPVSAARRNMLHLHVDSRQQARYLPDRCEHDPVAPRIHDFVKDSSLLCSGLIARHLRLCPDEPALIAREQIRYSYLLKGICTPLYLEGSPATVRYQSAGITHELTFG